MSSQPSPTIHRRQVWFQRSDPEIHLYYVDAFPPDYPKSKGVILLIHGFPESSHQFRKVMAPLANAGYRVIAPEYRGAGYSSEPPTGYTKKQLSTDLHQLLTEHLDIEEKVHVVGHDIGGMIAHAYCSQYSDDVASVIWGECPLPGSKLYENAKHSRMLWHFDFQSTPEISVALVTGRERMYIKYFFDRLAQDPSCFSQEDLDFYATQYSMPGALRAGFDAFANFENDAEDNRRWREQSGLVRIRSMMLNGEGIFVTEEAEKMAKEFYENVTMGVVRGSGHWIAEEQPEAFVEEVLKFVSQ